MEHWKQCVVTEVLVSGNKAIKLETSLGGLTNWIYLTKYTYNLLLSGVELSSLDGSIPDDTLVFLRQGPFSQNELGGEKTFYQKAFVTNAVANSVAYYAWVYLCELGLSGRQIMNLRNKYSFSRISTSPFNSDEIHASFINQSAFFLNLCGEMNAGDRFKAMAERLDDEKYEKYFKKYKDVNDLLLKYDRRIFHCLLECKAMRSNYDEIGTFHKNTGVFAENHTLEAGGYLIDVAYLQELRMRACRICSH